ncbi:MAG TPA: SH3 domain-containing protein [Promineifilum sp.]|nr:SH3 domain-containing protein [Promineifilum sp.]
MRDRTIVRLGLLILALTTLACNAFAGVARPTLPPPPLVVPSPATTGDAAVPDVAPTATLPGETPAGASQGTLRVLVDLNVRAGPGVGYERVGFLLRDETAVILGRDPASGWWKIACPPRAEGNDCWVSGGAQYTQAENAAAAPTAAVPASPTPRPPDPAPGTGLLVFIDSGRLFASTLDLTGDVPTAAPALQLGTAASVQRAAIAPDGRTVAFTVLDPTTGDNELRLIHADGANEHTLVRAAELPRVPEATELPAAATATASARAQVLDFQWQSDGAALVFNTALVSPGGFSAGSQSDLWTVTPQGQVTARLAAGRGLPRFVVSPDDRLLLIGRQEILRVAIDGRGLESVLTFEPVATAENVIYPTVQWSVDGTFALAAVTAPFAAGDATETRSAGLWRVPGAGAAVALGQVRADVVAASPRWSPDGQRLAYLRASAAGPELWLANGDGTRLERVAAGEGLRLLDWRAGNNALLFAGQDYAAVVQSGAPAIIAQTGGAVGRGAWLSDTAVVLALTDGSVTGFFVVTRDGTRQLLAPLSAVEAPLDVWLP